MSHPPPPANSNDPVFSYTPWAAWPITSMMAWSALTAASLESMFSFQRAWLEAGQELLGRRQTTAAPQHGAAADTPVMLAAAMGDLRDCSAAVMQAQADILDSWRRSA